MTRERFVDLVQDALDGLPVKFRRRMENLAVLVEDLPPEDMRSRLSPPSHGTGSDSRGSRRSLVLGVFVGVPRTERSVFQLPTGPDHIVLYQTNIEAVCSNDREIRRQVRLTVIHEVGHYFGMTEEQLRDV